MAKSDFTAAGLTVSEIELLVADATGLSISTATELKQIDQAITATGQAACLWRGIPWWFLQDFDQFDTQTKTIATVANSGAVRSSNVVTIKTKATTTHGLQPGQTVKISVTTETADTSFNGIFRVATVPTTSTFTYFQRGDDDSTSGAGTVYVISYPLRSIEVDGTVNGTPNTALMVFRTARTFSDVAYGGSSSGWGLRSTPWRRMQAYIRINKNQGASKPYLYTISGDEPLLYFWPPPDTTHTIICNFVKRHSEITGGETGSTDVALIIPTEYHRGVYVDGAIWLLRNGITETASLEQCPGFMRAMEAMQESPIRPTDSGAVENLFPDAQGGRFPQDVRVDVIDGEIGIWGKAVL